MNKSMKSDQTYNIMGNMSMGASGIASKSAGSNLGNNALQQMLMPSNSALESSQGFSAIDEIVNYRLDEIAEELEEKQIQHERKRREELKKVEQERKDQIKKIKEEYEEEIDYLKERAKHEAEINTSEVNEERKKQ